MEDIFSEADKAIEAKYGDQSDSAPGSGQAQSEVSTGSDQAPASKESKGSAESQAQALFDLSKAEKFVLNGKEMTLKDLQSQMMMQQDYTRKMQEIAKDREYRDNLEADLAKLERDPRLLVEFKKVYPKHFHRAGEYAARGVTQQAQAQSQQGTATQADLVKQIVEEHVGPIRNELDQYKTEAAVKQLDGIFSEMRGKYPDAKEKYVLSELQALKDMDVQIDRAKIEEVFKQLNDETKSLKESYHLEQLNKQKQATAKAKDIPNGGGIPGQAPKKYNLSSEKGWSELEKSFRNHLERQ